VADTGTTIKGCLWKPLPPRFFKIDVKKPETTVTKRSREKAAKVLVMAAMTP
jgi:hypothetical protein